MQEVKSQVKTPRIQANISKIGGTCRDERKWLEKILEYLHVDDPQQEGSPQVLHFLLKDWPMIKTTLHTVATMEKVKLLLVEMGIPYLHQLYSADPRSTRAQKWEYWNDFSPAGMQKFEQQYQEKDIRMEKNAVSDESDDETMRVEYEQYGTIGSMLVEEDNDSQTRMSDTKIATSLRG